MRHGLKLLAPVLTLGLVASACTGDGEGEGAGTVDGFPREETLFTMGQAWGPPADWNPITDWSIATGTIGLVYETLFHYDPIEDEYLPWLAEEGDWVDDDTYELTLREGLEWSDGEPLTAADVAFTLEIGEEDESVPAHTMWEWLESVEAVDELTFRAEFSDPRPVEWTGFLWESVIIPEHIFGEHAGQTVDDDEGNPQSALTAFTNEDPVGSGAYVYHSHDEDRQVWEKREGWWAEEHLDLEVAPTYVVDIVNTSNEVALGMMLQGELDISNNFLPGIDEILQGDFEVSTYYPEDPYMVGSNPTWMWPNHEREPMDDVEFRQALAHAINVEPIVETVYGGIVEAASPTGLLPVWDEFIDDGLVEQEGFTYDPDQARSILEDAGYTEGGDGFYETPDGDPIELEFVVQQGWTDWMEASRVIEESVQDAGINIQINFADPEAIDDMREDGDFDLLLNNEEGLGHSPWYFYRYLFEPPTGETQPEHNFGRYEDNDEVWGLIEELNRTDPEDTEAVAELTSQIQEIQLAELPAIPLWVNGMWSQVNNQVWTNWPEEGSSTNMPSTWTGNWPMGGLRMLTELESAAG